MEIRLLKPEEYALLGAIQGSDSADLKPETSIVAAAFDGQRLVGRLAALNLPHIECAWIDPEYRGTGILALLEKCLVKRLQELGAGLALAFAVDDRMESYCGRLGYRRLGTVWIKEI